LKTSTKLSTNMRTAITLLEVLLVAIIIALIVTILNTTAQVQLLAISVVTPQIILIIIFIYYCRKKKVWSYGGATILAILGITLRVIVSIQPNLEVGGGLPVAISTLYIVLGALVALKNYEAMIELIN
jgi:FtsH-binding integral membrane protein